MNSQTAAPLFDALSNADRLDVIRALVEAGQTGLNAGDIARTLGASPSRTSFHLTALARAGIVTRERRARSQTYRINFETLGGLISFLMRDCCQGSVELQACCGLTVGCPAP